MNTKVLLLGEANPYGGDPAFALWDQPEGASGDRLRRILGLRSTTYRALHRANLCPMKWSVREAKKRADVVLVDEPSRPWDVVVALGRKVAAAVGYAVGIRTVSGRRVPLAIAPWSSFVLDWMLCPLAVVALPHPSGLCREWNDPAAVERTRDLLRQHAPRVAWGEVPAGDAEEVDCVYCRTQPDDGPGCPCAHAPCVHSRAE